MRKNGKKGSAARDRMHAANQRSFMTDLAIAQKPNTPMLDPFSAPYKNGAYSLTNIEAYCHEAYVDLLADGRFGLVVACMDYRFANAAWRFVSKQIGQRTTPVGLFVAGGAAQEGDRLEDLAVLIKYLTDLGNFTSLWLMGHTDNCAGLQHFFCGGKKVTDFLGCKPNSAQEIAFVRQYVFGAQSILVPEGFGGKVHRYTMLNGKAPYAKKLK